VGGWGESCDSGREHGALNTDINTDTGSQGRHADRKGSAEVVRPPFITSGLGLRDK
jgi:hypothetical protein